MEILRPKQPETIKRKKQLQVINTFCPFPFRKIKVFASGDVTMCCHQEIKSLGNLLDLDFDEIWLGPRAAEIREWTLQSRLHPACRRRGVCPYIYQSRPETQEIKIRHDYPTFVELDLPNTHCNIGGETPLPRTACIMCPRSAASFVAQEDKTLVLAAGIRFLMPYLKCFMLSGLSEPFWKRRLFEVLDELGFAEFKNSCIIALFTNGTVFDHDVCHEFIETCPRARVTFSLDAATAETYRRIRRVNTFNNVLDNIRMFSMKKLESQEIMIANNINLLNIDEAAEMVAQAKDLGASMVHFNPTHNGGTEREDLENIVVGPHNYRLFEEAEKQIRWKAEEISMPVKFHRPLGLGFSLGQFHSS